MEMQEIIFAVITFLTGWIIGWVIGFCLTRIRERLNRR